MQKTNAIKKTPEISSARIPGAQQKSAAAASPSKSEISNVATSEVETKAKKVSPPAPLLALEGWGLASYSSSDEEDAGATVRVAKSAAAKKPAGKSSGKVVKGRAPSEDKYLVPPADREGEAEEFMPGTAAVVGDGELLLSSFDPFADAADDDAGPAAANEAVHLRVQQRNGRKTLTTVQGISAAYNYTKILRDLRRDLCCSGTIVDDDDLGKIIQLQGDHRKSVAGFLVKAGMVSKADVKIHGF